MRAAAILLLATAVALPAAAAADKKRGLRLPRRENADLDPRELQDCCEFVERCDTPKTAAAAPCRYDCVKWDSDKCVQYNEVCSDAEPAEPECHYECVETCTKAGMLKGGDHESVSRFRFMLRCLVPRTFSTVLDGFGSFVPTP